MPSTKRLQSDDVATDERLRLVVQNKLVRRKGRPQIVLQPRQDGIGEARHDAYRNRVRKRACDHRRYVDQPPDQRPADYLPDLEPADAHELLLTGAHVLIAQLGSQPATAAEISRVIGRSRDVVTQRLDELIKRGYVEHRGNRYEITAKLNVPNLQRHMRSNISIVKAAAKRLGTAPP